MSLALTSMLQLTVTFPSLRIRAWFQCPPIDSDTTTAKTVPFPSLKIPGLISMSLALTSMLQLTATFPSLKIRAWFQCQIKLHCVSFLSVSISRKRWNRLKTRPLVKTGPGHICDPFSQKGLKVAEVDTSYWQRSEGRSLRTLCLIVLLQKLTRSCESMN